MTPNYGWQETAVSAILAARNHIYVNAPTGSGKTFMMFKGIEALPAAKNEFFAVIVGRDTLIEQHRQDFIEKRGCVPARKGWVDGECEVITPSGKRVLMMTWQSLRSRELPNRKKLAALFFDECHIGGAGADNVSIKQIFDEFNPRLKVYVSATSQTANEDLLGEKSEGHVFTYSLGEAYEDGILHPVELVEVHTGIEARVAKFNEEFGNIEDYENRIHDSLRDQASEFAEERVGYGDTAAAVRATYDMLSKCQHQEMIHLYIALHADAREQAIFFCPSIDAACDASDYFNEHAGGLLSMAVHSQMEDSEPKELAKAFRMHAVDALFVVGMFQEGFDHPPLSLGFDCRFFSRWNKAKIARFVQKIGRLTRITDEKATSKFYYARSITDFYNQSVARARNPDEPVVKDDLFAASVVAGVLANGAHGSNNDQADSVISMTIGVESSVDIPTAPVLLIQEGETPAKFGDFDMSSARTSRVRLLTTPLYVLASARGYSIQRQYSFSQLFAKKEEVSARKKRILASATAPSRLRGNYDDYSFMLQHVRRDAAFAAEVTKRGWYNCNRETVAQRKSRILHGQHVPRHNSPEEGADYMFMLTYAKRDQEFADELHRRGWFFVRPKAEGVKSRKERIIQGGSVPKKGQPDYSFMLKHAKNDPIFADQLSKLGWYFADRETIEERKARILACATPPNSRKKEDKSDYDFMSRNAGIDAKFASELKNRGFYPLQKEDMQDRKRRILASDHAPRYGVQEEQPDYMFMIKYAKQDPLFAAELQRKQWFTLERETIEDRKARILAGTHKPRFGVEAEQADYMFMLRHAKMDEAFLRELQIRKWYEGAK